MIEGDLRRRFVCPVRGPGGRAPPTDYLKVTRSDREIVTCCGSSGLFSGLEKPGWLSSCHLATVSPNVSVSPTDIAASAPTTVYRRSFAPNDVQRTAPCGPLPTMTARL